MKTFLSIAAVLLLLTVTSCETQTNEDLQHEEQVIKDLENINIYARTDTGKDDSANSGGGDNDSPDNGEE